MSDRVAVQPLVLVVGRLSPEAKGVRGEAFAAGRGYSTSIVRAGGIPLLLPPITDLTTSVGAVLRRVDAVVMHGGGDVDPRRYGQERIAGSLYGIVDEHDEVELALVSEVLAQDVPLLAICRGMQVLNVALGGTLLQDIGSEEHWLARQRVALEPTSKAAEAMGTTTPTGCHCVHHQGLDEVGKGLTVTGSTPDGHVHAVEVGDRSWAVAVQWHPEDTAHDDPQQQGLFDALIGAARGA